jgi:hypothetical protein
VVEAAVGDDPLHAVVKNTVKNIIKTQVANNPATRTNKSDRCMTPFAA